MPVYAARDRETKNPFIPDKRKDKQTIWIPAWNDIIHLVPDKALPPAERKKRIRGRIIRMRQSPTPKLLSSVGTVMTLIDDVQDFMTSAGVVGRLLGRTTPVGKALAVGAFTLGEVLNALNILNRLPLPSRIKKREAERMFKNNPHWNRVKGDVMRRMKRVSVSKGEWLEILQTTDQVAGVGISLGPIVGLIEDLIFGLIKGAPIRIAPQHISDAELKALKKIATDIWSKWEEEAFASARAYRGLESSSLLLANPKAVSPADRLIAGVAAAKAYIQMRYDRTKDALLDVWDIIRGKPAKPPKRSDPFTLQTLSEEGFDPYADEPWPIWDTPAELNFDDVREDYEDDITEGILGYEEGYSGTPEGDLFGTSMMEAGRDTISYWSDDDATIEEAPENPYRVYTRAWDTGLAPPEDATGEDSWDWYDSLLPDQLYEPDECPPYRLLKSSYDRFFGE